MAELWSAFGTLRTADHRWAAAPGHTHTAVFTAAGQSPAAAAAEGEPPAGESAAYSCRAPVRWSLLQLQL